MKIKKKNEILGFELNNITDCQDITEILLKVALNTPLSSFQKKKLT